MEHPLPEKRLAALIECGVGLMTCYVIYMAHRELFKSAEQAVIRKYWQYRLELSPFFADAYGRMRADIDEVFARKHP